MEPFAVQLYKRFTDGETVEEMAAALRISAERVAVRIRAAQTYLKEDRSTEEESRSSVLLIRRVGVAQSGVGKKA